MRLYEVGLGPYSRPITTTSPDAQRYFDQGMQLLFSFTPVDAARSFREAQKLDASCAMCFWGEAMAWGPYLNSGMSAAAAPRAFAAAREAERRAAGVSPVERGLIDAVRQRYTPVHEPANRAALDSAYAQAMRDVWERFPEDLDVTTLFGEALMLLEPRRGLWDIERPSVARIHGVLETVLERDIMHPGACHLYVHATEATTAPEKAEACADHLGQAIPGASHINHMPSHTYNRVGRWGDAVRANIEAWHSDLRAEVGEGFAIYPSHNLHMLLFAASYDGQGAIAIQASKDYAGIVRGGSFYHALSLMRFGRFDEVLALDDRPEAPIFRGLFDFARGYAHLRTGDPGHAREALARVEQAALEGGTTVAFRGHTAEDLLGIAARILRAELLQDEGSPSEAIELLEEATTIEDLLRYDEPEPLNFSAYHWLGAHLLEAGRADEAERAYRTELAKHPRNGWSLIGLEAALRAQERVEEALEVQAVFRDSWQRSDSWIRSSRF